MTAALYTLLRLLYAATRCYSPQGDPSGGAPVQVLLHALVIAIVRAGSWQSCNTPWTQ
jgi:hypothetical protein